MLFVVHAVDKTDMLPTRAKFYRAHRVHLDDAANYDVDVVAVYAIRIGTGKGVHGGAVLGVNHEYAAHGSLAVISNECARSPPTQFAITRSTDW